MKNLLLILIISILSSNISFSQVKKKKYKSEEENQTCAKVYNISLKDRLLAYPYNMTSQIKLVSLKNKAEGMIGDELSTYLKLIVKNKDSIIENKFDEIQVLNFNQVEKLTNIFYNYGYKTKPNSYSITGCYEPRNAILFYDNKNKIIGYIEICFGCNQYAASIDKLTIGDECTEKFKMIKEVFKECGIKYGITIVE